MFGRSLEETMKVEARLGGTYIPVLLHRCVKFIQEHGGCADLNAKLACQKSLNGKSMCGF